jgi:hypothetical protein
MVNAKGDDQRLVLLQIGGSLEMRHIVALLRDAIKDGDRTLRLIVIMVVCTVLMVAAIMVCVLLKVPLA